MAQQSSNQSLYNEDLFLPIHLKFLERSKPAKAKTAPSQSAIIIVIFVRRNCTFPRKSTIVSFGYLRFQKALLTQRTCSDNTVFFLENIFRFVHQNIR